MDEAHRLRNVYKPDGSRTADMRSALVDYFREAHRSVVDEHMSLEFLLRA